MSSLKSGSSGCIGLPCLCSKLAMYACNSFDGSGCMGMALIMLPVDPFGPSEVRRVERALIEEYRAMVLRALEMPSLHDAAVAIAELPDLVRGYEAIKLRNVQRFHERAAAARRSDMDAQPDHHCAQVEIAGARLRGHQAAQRAALSRAGGRAVRHGRATRPSLRAGRNSWHSG